ncbi:hypothetical protein Ddye_018261 [Dipteronia dyeriana]|uniref:Myb/SANT-like domain-containing protein n=1 Tax=Dipteronia dyeriana TaxID=168575 RepID=A0AAD9UAX6_9ROSI|nr:hypothetical protein Ddye_018261 [Dipteronia dyeriana]
MRKKKYNNDINKRDRFLWTPQMDDRLIDTLYTQHAQGNRVGGNFTSKAYENIVLELREKLGKNIDKDKVKNRMKSLKTNFSECYDLFNKGALSGFAWNSVTKIWSAEPEVWENLLEANPSAKKWRHTPIGNYEKLVDLFAKDRATCAGAETPKEKCKRWENGSGDDCETIEGIDQLLSQNEVKSVAHMDDDMDTMVSPGTTSQIPTQTARLKRKKGKTSNAEHNPDEMIKAIHYLAEAIK